MLLHGCNKCTGTQTIWQRTNFEQHPTYHTIMKIIYHHMIRNQAIRHIPNADYNLHPTELALDLGNLDIQRM